MELLYEPQDLIAWQLNNSFNRIHNCDIIKPSWKWANTYWDTFFVQKRPCVKASAKNTPTWNIMDSIDIDWTEFLLIFNGSVLDVAYDDWVNFTWYGLSYPIWEYTPSRLIKWESALGWVIDNIAVADSFIDWNYKWLWNATDTYQYNAIVDDWGTNYICIIANAAKQPSVNSTEWSVYTTDLGWYDISDPDSLPYRDVYKGWYLKLKLTKANIRDSVVTWTHLLFDNNDSNLQGVSTKIHYTETSYIDYLGVTINLPSSELYVYVRGTNLAGTKPFVWELVSVTSDIGTIPLVATQTKLVSLHTILAGSTITWVKAVDLYECEDWDEIVDVTIYNWVVFILTQNKLLYSRMLTESNINFYPLDFFNDIRWGLRLIDFGKMLVIFGEVNAVVTTVTWTNGSIWYVYTWLNYNDDLYSKYSAISAMGSLYVLQADKQFMKLDIATVTNIDYQVTATNMIQNVRGLFENVIWDVYMNKWKKDIYVIDTWAFGTHYYKNNIEYQHWDTGDYLNKTFKIQDMLYWDDLYEFNTDFFDNTVDYPEQYVWFDFGWESLHTLKQVQYVKFILWLNEKIVDYTLEIQYQIAGNITTKVIDLSNYPVNIEIVWYDWGLWDSQLNETLLWEGNPQDTATLGNFISVTVGVWITASVFDFRLKSKENWFIYWGSIIGYANKIPVMTEYNYKH